MNLPPVNNPWNEVYLLEAGKKNLNPDLSNLRSREGIQTKNTENTKRYMLEPFKKGDINNEDDDDNRRARLQSQLTTNTVEGK